MRYNAHYLLKRYRLFKPRVIIAKCQRQESYSRPVILSISKIIAEPDDRAMR